GDGEGGGGHGAEASAGAPRVPARGRERNLAWSAGYDGYKMGWLGSPSVPAAAWRSPMSSERASSTRPRFASDLAGALVVLALASLAPARVARADWSAGGSPVCTLPGIQSAPTLAPDGAGGAYLVWKDAAQGNDLFIAHLGADGLPVTGWPAQGRRVASTPHERLLTTLGADGAGGVNLAWSVDPVGGDGEPHAIRLDASGATSPGWVPDGNPLPNGNYGETAAADGLGGLWVTYGDWYSFCPDICYYDSGQSLSHVGPDGVLHGDEGVISSPRPFGATYVI